MESSIVIDLDPETAARLREEAKRLGVPLSRYISDLLRHRALVEWPVDVLQLAGTWADFPDPEELRALLNEQPHRETL
jgi:hypothetical protein